MKWILAVFLSCAAAAQAQPSLGFRDNFDGTVTLQVTPDADLLPGSLAAEAAISIVTQGVTLTGAEIADESIWDLPIPGDNPFLPGLPIGGDAFGLDLGGLADNEIFVAYGARVLLETEVGPTDLLTISYEGSGTILANGQVAQSGRLFPQDPIELFTFPNLAASVAVGVPEPTTGALGALMAISLFVVRSRR